MTLIGPWTCQHNGCLKHAQGHHLSNEVGHTCCGRCPSGKACKDAAWGHAPLFPHAYVEGLMPGVRTVCKQGSH
jgi:hypothetical protein